MPTYQPNIPTGSVPFNEDYLNLQANFQQLNIAYGVDHVPFSNTSGIPPSGQSGLHTVVHLQANSTTSSNPPNNYPPTAVTPVGLTGELFCTQSNDGINPDEILWYQTGGGRLMQLTRNFAPVANTNGYTFLPGGLILQWGTVNGTHAGVLQGGDTGTVTFSSANIAFPSNCFEVWTQPFYTSAAPNGAGVVATKLNGTTSFSWIFNTNSGSYNGFFWAAIGK